MFFYYPISTSHSTQTSGVKIEAYPNPFSHTLNINIPDAGDVEKKILVRDVSGRIVFETKQNDAKFTLDLRELNKGVYFVSIISRDFTGKVQVVNDR